MADYVLPLQRLIEAFRKLPGIGSKTATRLAFSVLNFSEEEAAEFADAVRGAKTDSENKEENHEANHTQAGAAYLLDARLQKHRYL